MSPFSRLLRDEKGSVFDRFALICAVISIICVLGAHGMDRLAQSGSLPSLIFHSQESGGGIDYAATASIARRAQDAGLNPCSAK
jgi:hypothetical protein